MPIRKNKKEPSEKLIYTNDMHVEALILMFFMYLEREVNKICNVCPADLYGKTIYGYGENELFVDEPSVCDVCSYWIVDHYPTEMERPEDYPCPCWCYGQEEAVRLTMKVLEDFYPEAKKQIGEI